MLWTHIQVFPFAICHSPCPISFSDLFFLLSDNFFSFQLLNRKDKTTFEKLDYLMSKEDNYKRTRDYIRSLKMVPSIPYLGMNLSWLILLLTFQATCLGQIRCFYSF